MALDIEQFLVQSLSSLLGGLVGVSIGAWLGGLYKIKGEITGRAEMLKEILAEVKASAKATEVSKIAGRAEGIITILNEVSQTTKASEGAKIAIRLEKLDEILPEVRAVTETQKRIEATVAGGEWDRQWRLNQIRDAYGRLLAAVYGLQDAYLGLSDYEVNPLGVADAGARDADLHYRKHAAEFKTATALTRIFAGRGAANALDHYEQRIQHRLHMPEGTRSKQAIRDLGELHNALLHCAKADLGV